MRLQVSMKYAFRSLYRHPRRSILSVVGIGVGCGLCLFIIGWVGGESRMMLRAAAQSGAGHIRIAPKGWHETRENNRRLNHWEDLRRQVEGSPQIATVTPHARIEGLLGFGTRTAGVEILGVDPQTERQSSRLVKHLHGEYLNCGSMGTVVVGRTIAERLDVGIGDQLMVTVSGKDGEMSSAMLRLVGIIDTGSRDMDATICQVTLPQVERLTGYPGAAELTVLVDDPDRLPRIVAELRRELPADCEVLTWAELLPELASGVEIDHVWSALTVAILMIVVFLGIASAQLAAVLERRREFAVLAALGMKSGRLVMIMVYEGFLLGLAGALAALAVGVPSTWYVATQGVDFSRLIKDFDMTVSNILIDPIFYGAFGMWLLPCAFGLALSATMLSSLYPAWFAVCTNPASALRVEN